MLGQQWDILCWKVARLEPLPNDRNIVGRNMSCAFGHPVAMCCDMSGVVGANLKMVQFFMQYLWILHDSVVVKALVNEDTLLPIIFLGLRKLGNICC